jgi:hypothetical protein
MVPDRDRRAIERKIFPAEVGILLTRHPRPSIVLKLSAFPPRLEKD